LKAVAAFARKNTDFYSIKMTIEINVDDCHDAELYRQLFKDMTIKLKFYDLNVINHNFLTIRHVIYR